jgi:hypothetical protein
VVVLSLLSLLWVEGELMDEDDINKKRKTEDFSKERVSEKKKKKKRKEKKRKEKKEKKRKKRKQKEKEKQFLLDDLRTGASSYNIK